MKNRLPQRTMNDLQSEKSSMSPEELNNKGQTSHVSGQLPQDRTKKDEAPADFWQAIRTVIGLQHQAPPLQAVERNGNLALSFPQERLWLLDQLAPGSSSYNVPMPFRVTGPLNVPALEQSLNEIVQRHEALRTTFATVDGQPVQVIAPALTLTISVVDLRELPETERQTQTLQLVTESAQQPFNLSQGPLLRAALLQLGQEEHVMLLSVHHIVFDGWSAGVLFEELSVLYEAFLTGKPKALPELPIQYADFSVWQRQWLQGEFLTHLLDYWKQQLGGDLLVQHLPTDHSRPAVQNRRSASQTLVLSETLTSTLKALSRREGITLFTTLLAAFNVLLYSYTGQEDLFVCTPTANRNRTETKRLIGYFVNLLVLRTDLSGNPSFRELLSRTRKMTSGAYSHQDLPVRRLVDCLNLVHVPLSQVMFVLQNVPSQPLELPGLTVSSLEIDNGTADFDLFLSMFESGENLSGVLKYNTDLFDHTTITLMLNQFQLLLESIVENPDQPLSSLPLLTQTESYRQGIKRSEDAAALLLSPNEEMDHSTLPVFDQARLELERAYTSGSTEYVAPRDSVELQLTNLWEKVLDIQPIGVKDNFFDLGGQSLLALHLFMQIEKIFDKNLPLSTLFQATTIEQQASILQQSEWSPPWDSLVAIQSSGSKPPLFCVHAIDGNVLVFQNLARQLEPNQPVYGLQAKGLDGKQSPHTRFEEMAADYIKEIRTVQPEGPYLLAGYSAGGVVAFEMAQQLHAQGQKVALLALIDSYCPVYFNPQSFLDLVSRHLGNLLRLEPKDKLTYFVAVMGAMEQRLQKISRKFYPGIGRSSPQADKKSSPTSIVVANNQAITETDIFAAQKQAIRDAVRDYVPQVYSGRVTLFRSAEQPWWMGSDRQLGWGRLAADGLELHEVPGDHLTIIRENVRFLAEQFRACLDQAQENERAFYAATASEK